MGEHEEHADAGLALELDRTSEAGERGGALDVFLPRLHGLRAAAGDGLVGAEDEHGQHCRVLGGLRGVLEGGVGELQGEAVALAGLVHGVARVGELGEPREADGRHARGDTVDDLLGARVGRFPDVVDEAVVLMASIVRGDVAGEEEGRAALLKVGGQDVRRR